MKTELQISDELRQRILQRLKDTKEVVMDSAPIFMEIIDTIVFLIPQDDICPPEIRVEAWNNVENLCETLERVHKTPGVGADICSLLQSKLWAMRGMGGNSVN